MTMRTFVSCPDRQFVWASAQFIIDADKWHGPRLAYEPAQGTLEIGIEIDLYAPIHPEAQNPFRTFCHASVCTSNAITLNVLPCGQSIMP